VWRTIDLVLRIIYVVIAPLMLVICAAIFPITGLLISAAIATLVAMFGAERWRARVKDIPLLGRVLGGMSKLGEFYNTHPAKPLVYYIFYPVLLPVILFMRVPRREFLLYRKLGVLALVIIVGTSTWDYVHHWRPELPFTLFLTAVIVGFMFQLLVTFSMIMPLVTTFVILNQRHLRKTTWAVFVVAVLSGSVGALGAHRSHGMSITTWMRLKTRSDFAAVQLRNCLAEHNDPKTCGTENRGTTAVGRALFAGCDILHRSPADVDNALTVARDALEDFYKPDEAAEFRFYFGEGVCVIYVQFGREPALWLGRDAAHVFHDPAKLPVAAHTLLKL
jgi:hypothetical protein